MKLTYTNQIVKIAPHFCSVIWCGLYKSIKSNDLKYLSNMVYKIENKPFNCIGYTHRFCLLKRLMT